MKFIYSKRWVINVLCVVNFNSFVLRLHLFHVAKGREKEMRKWTNEHWAIVWTTNECPSIKKIKTRTEKPLLNVWLSLYFSLISGPAICTISNSVRKGRKKNTVHLIPTNKNLYNIPNGFIAIHFLSFVRWLPRLLSSLFDLICSSHCKRRNHN